MDSSRSPASATVGAEHEKREKGKPKPDVRGGQLATSLAADELDAIIKPYLGRFYISAYALYEVRTGRKPPAQARAAIERHVRSQRWCMAALHTKDHWSTAFFTHDEKGETCAHIYDSAPSVMNKLDFESLCNKLGIKQLRVTTHARQPRFSEECGLHVLWLAAMQSPYLYEPVFPESMGLDPEAKAVVSLDHWRAYLPEILKRGMDDEIAQWLVQTALHSFHENPLKRFPRLPP